MNRAILRLYQLGYLWHVDPSDLLKLSPADDIIKKAVLSIQAKYPNQFHMLMGQKYPKISPYSYEQTGQLGPAAEALITGERFCPLPDILPPKGTIVDRALISDPDLYKAIDSMGKSQGSGAWPYGCWDGFNMHRLLVNVDTSNATQYWKNRLPALQKECRINYSWTGLRIDFVTNTARADVKLSFKRGNGWIGLAEFPDGTCSDEVFCYLDPTYQPGDDRYALNLLQHELGHNNKLGHTNGGIMNPYINNSNPDWRQDISWNTLKRYYGGQGSPDILSDDPKPPEVPPPQEANGVYVYQGKVFKIKVWE